VAKKKQVCLNDARTIAYEVLLRVDQGAYSDLALDGILATLPDLDVRERSLATELVYGVLRRRANLDFILSAYSRQPIAKLEIQALWLLRLGTYQLIYLDKIPQHAAVNSTVELARKLGLERITGLINGTLRTMMREPQRVQWPTQDRPLDWLMHKLSLPRWLAQRWLNEFGAEQAGALAQTLLQVPPTTLRVNTLKCSRDEFMAQLEAAGLEARATHYAPEGVVIERGHLRAVPDLDPELYQMQDEASMLIAHLLQAQPGDKVVDVCAAPGGKTTHVAALTKNQATITALDLHEKRLALLQRSAERLGAVIETAPWDMTQPCTLFPRGSFNRVLVDAPCSGLGVLRRNPEARWRRSEADVVRLAKLQKQILANAAQLVAPGGLLVYSLCTTTAEESVDVVAEFLQQHAEFSQEDLRSMAPQHWQELFNAAGQLVTFTNRHASMDCFFAAALRRRA